MNPLFNYDVEVDPMSIDIRSETLEPISSSKRRVVFRLDAAGNLDQNSVLLFKTFLNAGATSAPQNGELRCNEMFGGLLAIKRATLQIGDYILNDTQDIGRIAALTSMASMKVANRNQLLGHYYQNQFHAECLQHYDGKRAPHGGTGTIVDDGHKSGIYFGDRNSLSGNENAAINSCSITNNAENNYQFGIPLGTILPCLKGRSLPLYLFQEYRILITIEFHDAPEWVNNISMVESPTEANAVTSVLGTNYGMCGNPEEVTYTDVKLQVDYLIMPSEIQAQSRAQLNQQGGLRLDFFDIIKVEKNIPAATANAKQVVEHRIGADNKEVHKIYMIKRLDQDVGNVTLTAGAPHTAGTADKTDGAYTNVPMIAVTGVGQGMTANFTVAGNAMPQVGGGAGELVIANTGFGYKAGDLVKPQIGGAGNPAAGTDDTRYLIATGGGMNVRVPKDRLFVGARCDGMNQEEYNINIDGVDIFQEDKFSPASQYDETSNCLGMDLEFPRPVYFCDENSIQSRIADVHGGLLGQYKPLCLDLTNGEPVIVGGGRNIGAYPIIFKYSRTPLAKFPNPATEANGGKGFLWDGCDQSMEVDYFMMVSRVANVRSTPQGTAVSVSY